VRSDSSPSTVTLATWFARGGLACAWIGAAASAWAVLAQQSPASPYRAPGFYEPIEALALRSFVLAGLTLGSVRLASRGGLFADDQRSRARLAWALWVAGVALTLAAMAYSAATGSLGVQLRDAGQHGHNALIVRWLGGALTLGCLALAQGSIARGARGARGAEETE
jgi:hypothetical protein